MKPTVPLTDARRELIRGRIAELGLKKSDVAEALNVHPGTVTKILSTQLFISEETAVRLAEILRLDEAALLEQYTLVFGADELERASDEATAQLKQLARELGQVHCRRLMCIVGFQVVSSTERTYQRMFEVPLPARPGESTAA